MSGSQPSYSISNGHPASPVNFMPNDVATSNGDTTNGDHSHDGHFANGDHDVAGPSSGTNGYTRPPYVPSHNERIVDHLFNAGFQLGEFADTILHAHQNSYRLHAIILSRSPFLAHLMSVSPKTPGAPHTIYVPLESFPEISDQGFAVALGYLYSSVSLNSVSLSNARSVLAAGCLLGGMDELCSYAYQACRSSITLDTIDDWIDFVDGLSTSDGSSSPSEASRPTVLGPYASQLRSDVFHFLVVTLPTILDVQSSTSSGRDSLLRIFSRIPFDLFKSAVESPTFSIGSDQERFRFAKAAIDLRKRTRGNSVEETVVLAFGGSNSGSAVHVTRKTRKRALFKVG